MTTVPESADLVVDVVVVGAGVAGFVAARECLLGGLSVVVVEAGDRPGGNVAARELAGLRLDMGAESFATRGGSVAALLDELGLTADIVEPAPGGARLRLPRGRTGAHNVPLPKTGILGIPARPLAPDVVAAIGLPAALRAQLDRLLPLSRSAASDSLGRLVRRRMGRRVLERLVTPITRGVYSSDADSVDIDTVAPGLRAAMLRAGSLSAGVAELRDAAKAGSAVQGIRGGVARLVDALLQDVLDRGARVLTGSRAVDARPLPTGGYRLHHTGRSSGDGGLTARYLILAADAESSLRLLGALHPEWNIAHGEWQAGATVDVVTLVLDEPALDTHPVGTGVLIAEGTPRVTAKALTHATAKWSWLAEAAGPGRHVVRLSYGRAGDTSPVAAMDDERLQALALADASEILGVPLTRLVAFARARWSNAGSHAAPGQAARITQLRSLLHDEPALAVTGGWLAGTGLASVVADSRRAGRRIREHAEDL